MGVITTGRLAEGTSFGPVPPTVTLTDPIVLIGHRTCDTPPDIHTVKMDVLAYSSGSAQLAEWVPYVQAARDHVEQNLEATIDETDNQLYFRVIRTIAANCELLVWYSDKLAECIGVPEVGDECVKGDSYSCPNCHETFIYPNCLRAHMRFRCRNRQKMQLLQKSPTEVGGDVNNQTPEATDRFPLILLSGVGETAAGQQSRAHSGQKKFEFENNNHVTSQEDQNDEHKFTPGKSLSNNFRGDANNAPAKRKRYHYQSSDDESVVSATRAVRRRKSESPGALTGTKEQEQVAGLRNRSVPHLPGSAFYHFANVGNVRASSPLLSSPSDRCDSLESPSTTSPSGTALVTLPNTLPAVNPESTTEDLRLATGNPQNAAALAAAAMMGGVYMLPGLAAARAAAASLPLGFQHLERLRAAAAAAAAAATVQQTPAIQQQSQLTAIEQPLYQVPATGHHPHTHVNNNNIDEGLKQYENENRLVTAANNPGLQSPSTYGLPLTSANTADPRFGTLPFVYRNQNPMVLDKMLQLFGGAAPLPSVANHPVTQQTNAIRQPSIASLQPPPSAGPPVLPQSNAVSAGGPLQSTFLSLNLSQNWCAKCNTSFRMTSDLVYHMRSHHKRDFDPVKRRKDDKLRCDVCGETFRERHHLTRHMTSHS